MYLKNSRQPHGKNNPDTSALLTALLGLLKEKKPELCSPALRRLETRRERRRHP